jgi:hypothetical protein
VADQLSQAISAPKEDFLITHMPCLLRTTSLNSDGGLGHAEMACARQRGRRRGSDIRGIRLAGTAEGIIAR